MFGVFPKFVYCGFHGCPRQACQWIPVVCQTFGPADMAVCPVHADVDVTHCPCRLCVIARRAVALWN